MDNIGFAHCMLQEYDKACPVSHFRLLNELSISNSHIFLQIYEAIVTLQQESYGDQAQKGWSISLKKLIFCQVKLYHFEKAFDNLRALEEYLSSRATKTKSSYDDLDRTHALMGEVNYQIFKFPTLAEYTSRAVGCGLCTDDRDGIEVDMWFPKKPSNGSKMSGHRMTYA